ncbi:MAG: YebC/PmpR family DNA-binding transcriptional regulator [Candidatus Eremiobacteraeota bacterium]|nr:YebC/PmpR family DNA-binding transcriptional regulator [Candidatus Eremiobacteraeota bacterium]MBC5826478.1 YebC/PmpR family DNA-binding transcriptional regulator [Candidatus Eremiobacteraeota bacterium]
MSGHSKWHNIRLRKGKVDAQRGQLFTKLSKEIIVAAKSGPSDPEANLRLKMAVLKARGANMPVETIKRAIARSGGEVKGQTLEEVRYEGYGPVGVAIMVDAVTDNRHRTASEMRYVFSRNGGNLGETGCVAWLFVERGVLTVPTAGTLSEEDLLDCVAVDGVLDVRFEGDTADIITEPPSLGAIREHIERTVVAPRKKAILFAGIRSIAKAQIDVPPVDGASVLALLDRLEEHDDVTSVASNADIADAVLEALA